MIVPAAELKHQLKKLSGVKSEVFWVGEHGISAQDSDIWVVVESPLNGLDGPFSVSGKKLTQVVNRMGGKIEVSQTEKSLILKSNKALVELETQKIKKQVLPELPDKFLEFPASEFKKALAAAVSTASPAKSAAFGGCVQLQTIDVDLEEVMPFGYRILGSDGNVLTLVRKTAPMGFEMRALINLSAAATIRDLGGDVIKLGETNSHFLILAEGIKVFASKPVQQYPNFSSLLTVPSIVSVKLNPQDWLSALQTVEPLIDETVDKGAVSLLFRENVVELANVSTGSKAKDEAPYEQVDPDPVFDPKEIGLKLKAEYLSGFLKKAENPSWLRISEKADHPVRLESGDVTVITRPLYKAVK